VKARWLLAIGGGALILSQVLAYVSWEQRPAAQDTTGQGADLRAELDPGEFAGTLMLAGLRGVAIDLLWLRAANAREQSHGYESVALTSLISRVQPRFETVWNYLAWDLAYNLAADTDDPEEKWQWFQAGIQAGMRGIERNPQSYRITSNIAWMFFHKGDDFLERIESAQWKPVLAKVFAVHGEQAVLDHPVNAFDISAALYRIARRQAGNDQFRAIDQRFVAISVDKSGNRLHNQGQDLRALERWLDAIEEWQNVVKLADDPNWKDDSMRRIHRDIYSRHEGRLRRKAAHLASMIAPDAATGSTCAKAIETRNIAAARILLSEGTWKPRNTKGFEIRWRDVTEGGSKPTLQ
jgi:hypothetical protein